ncbi:MAG: cell division FtsA domain-containing protein [Candidatus Saccharimonadales bacterium]
MLAKLKQRFNKKPTDRHIVALDIGTEYVKALIARVVTDAESGETKAEIIGVGRKHQGLSDMHSGAIADIAGVVSNCDTALTEAEKMAGVSVEDAVVGIAGELVKGNTTTIKYRRSDAKKDIDNRELKEIIEQVQRRALERARAELAWESGVENIEITMVNAAVVNVSIDGYKVTNPIGFQGKDVSVQLFCAFAPMVHISAIERVALDLNLNLIGVTAEPFAVAKSVGADVSESFSAIFIDVGGGTTDIALVNDGGVEGTKMFGIGGRSFTTAVAKALDIDFAAAEKRKCDLTTESKDESVRKSLVPTVKVWLSGVELALSEFTNIDQLPSKILLCGGGSGLPYVPRALMSKAWREQVPIAHDIVVEHIDPAQVDRVVDTTGKVTDYAYITPMGLLNVGLDAITAEPPSQKFINKLNQAMQS